MAIEIGQPAPEVTLKNVANEVVTLADFAGSPLLVVFYPFAFSGICEGELCRIRDDFSIFEDAGVQVVAVSVDSRHALKAWGEQQGYQFPFLSDFWPHGAAAQAFGVFNDKVGAANRATFLIGKDGVVVDCFATDDLGTPREAERYTEALAKL